MRSVTEEICERTRTSVVAERDIGHVDLALDRYRTLLDTAPLRRALAFDDQSLDRLECRNSAQYFLKGLLKAYEAWNEAREDEQQEQDRRSRQMEHHHCEIQDRAQREHGPDRHPPPQRRERARQSDPRSIR